MERAIDKLEPFQRAISKAHLASAGISIDSLQDTNKPLIAMRFAPDTSRCVNSRPR